MNTKMVIKLIIESTYKEELCLIFIDFKSAYNTILREKLWIYMKTLNLFSLDEIEFIKIMIDKLHFKCNNKTFYFKNGVP